MLEHSSYLIQRLRAPYHCDVKTPLQALAKYGLAATGFTSEAKELIAQICVFDYMGSSEYEWGAIPKAIRAMMQKKLCAIALTVHFNYHCFSTQKDTSGERIVYVISPEEDIEEVKKRVEEFALDKIRCKERTLFTESLAEYRYGKDILGWFDLDNHFMFFKDVQMFRDWGIVLGCRA